MNSARGLSLGSIALGGALGAGVGAGLAIWWMEQQRGAPTTRRATVEVADREEVAMASSSASSGTALASDPMDHPALKHGMPVGSVLRPFTNFVSYFDTRTRNPHWVIERISEETSRGSGDRKYSRFKEDDNVPEKLRNKLEDFRGSGYDRGHMAPASAHKLSQNTMDETFTLSNISPQVGAGFNRDYWARFEAFVKSLSKDCEEVHVVTGPLFLPQPKQGGGALPGDVQVDRGGSQWEMRYALLGEAPDLVAVPTHFFKIILTTRVRNKGSKGRERRDHSVGSFVMPNEYIDPETPLSSFSVPLDALERATGTIFFPNLITGAGRANGLVDGSHAYDFDRQSLKWQAKGKREMERLVEFGSADDGGTAAAVVVAEGGERQGGEGRRGALTRVRAVDHLCDATTCELPPENFWKKK